MAAEKERKRGGDLKHSQEGLGKEKLMESWTYLPQIRLLTCVLS